jgi:hypothetical protein
MLKNLKGFLVTIFVSILLFACFIFLNCTDTNSKVSKEMGIDKKNQSEIIEALIEKYGQDFQDRIETGVLQAATRWRESDGNVDEFKNFCLNHFTTNSKQLEIIFSRFQKNLEILYGNLHRISRNFNWALHVDIGPVYPIDYLFANYEPFAHVDEDLFKTKLAFVILLNYPLPTLLDKEEHGLEWSREKWAETRLVEIFKSRVPADIIQKRSETYTLADDYISNYNIFMHNLLTDEGELLFPEGLKLISHWGLRDELKAQYANSDGFNRQKMIQKVMERIIRQEIPKDIINSDKYNWNPFSNEIKDSTGSHLMDIKEEPNTRYIHLLDTYKAEKLLDPYYPQAPSLIDRRFKINREISELDVENLLKSVLTAPVLKEIAINIKKRLGRELEPFDIWYNGFKPHSKYSEEDLDKKVSELYPSVETFQKDIPYILRKIGFSPQKTEFLSQHIQVDPSRGAGHAMGAAMSEDKAHLRTRIPETGMKYKGFNIAIHELGHNVEQIFSLNEVDYYSLNGVPNTAFTEAFAFLFQSRDLDVLGIKQSSNLEGHLRALNDLWATFEISGVALTDMYIWRWMYKNPKATPEELKNAMLETAIKNWNDYFAPVLGMNDQILLAIYSHIIDGGMYTPDYPMGHIISFQIEQYLQNRDLAEEIERMCKFGRLSPQVWMQKAVGQKITAEPLIQAAEEALDSIPN